MPNAIITQLEINVDGVLTTFDIQDQGARELIEALGNAVYWMGLLQTLLQLKKSQRQQKLAVWLSTTEKNLYGMAPLGSLLERIISEPLLLRTLQVVTSHLRVVFQLLT